MQSVDGRSQAACFLTDGHLQSGWAKGLICISEPSLSSFPQLGLFCFSVFYHVQGCLGFFEAMGQSLCGG